MMNRSNNRQTSRHHARRGVIVPLVAVAILLVGSSIALVLNHLWLSTARTELLSVAEGSALAASRLLFDDEHLKFPDRRVPDETRQQQRIELARLAADDVARNNLVAGHNVELDLTETGDVRFGKLVRQRETGQVLFLETAHKPTSVLVTAQRTRSRNNPVAMLFEELVGDQGGDVAARAEATWDNRLVGLRPRDDVAVPAMPLAILENTDTSTDRQGWSERIEQFQGEDNFRFDADKHAVVAGADGLPEIVIDWCTVNSRNDSKNDRVSLGGSSTPLANGCMLQLGSASEANASERQIDSGWVTRDLKAWNGEIRLQPGTLDVWGRPQPTHMEIKRLAAHVGECRIFCLYQPQDQSNNSRLMRVRLTRFVAARIMAVEGNDARNLRITLQPGIVVTRAALLAAAPGHEADETATANPYIYKIQLTQ